MPLDVGVGLILGVLLSQASTLPYSWCLLIGVIAALLPDIDYVWSFIHPKRKTDTTHRDLLHYPLLFIPAVGLLGLLMSRQISVILMAGAFAHFVHDSFGVGFGLKWLFPLTRKSYMFLFQASTPRNKTMPKKLLYAWDDKERATMIKQYGYSNWIRHIYFHPHPFGLFEYTALLIGILFAITLHN